MLGNSFRRIVFGVAAAGGVLLLATVSAGAAPRLEGAPAAQSEATSKATYCDAFVQHLAKDLGKSESDLRSALRQAAGETIDDAVKAGDLSSQQADQLKAKIGNRAPCAFHLGRPGHKRGGFGVLGSAYQDAAAKALGISADELKADLRKGMTLHQIADSKGISEAQFRSALIQNVTPALDAAVKDGRLSANQEKSIIDRLQKGPLPLWDRAERQRGPRPTPTPGS